MSKATEGTLKRAYKPYDIVSDKEGNVGFIYEVSVNECQESFDDQISYSVEWIIGKTGLCSWYRHYELTSHCNMLIKIAEQSCHPMGNNRSNVLELMRNI